MKALRLPYNQYFVNNYGTDSFAEIIFRENGPLHAALKSICAEVDLNYNVVHNFVIIISH